jgi:hypothetical protein
MSQFVVVIGQLEDDHEPEVLTELWRQTLPEVHLEGLAPQPTRVATTVSPARLVWGWLDHQTHPVGAAPLLLMARSSR